MSWRPIELHDIQFECVLVELIDSNCSQKTFNKTSNFSSIIIYCVSSMGDVKLH